MRHEIIHLNALYPLENDPILEAFCTELADWQDGELRRAMLVLPGGGYTYTSNREADPIAFAFGSRGYISFVLRYTTERQGGSPKFPTPNTEVMAAVDYIRKNAKEYHINPDKICLVGFSAGGHLAASYGYVYKNENLLNRMNLKAEDVKPNALVLGYPVISTGTFTHSGTALNACASDPDLLRYLSVENHVDETYPMTFVWCTLTDQAVPCQNTQMLEEQLIKHNVVHQAVYFPKGPHGMSLANEATDNTNPDFNDKEVAKWVDMANEFILKNLGR